MARIYDYSAYLCSCQGHIWLWGKYFSPGISLLQGHCSEITCKKALRKIRKTQISTESEWGREKNIPTVRWGKHLHTVGLLSHHLTPLCPRSCSFTLDVLCMSALSEIPLLSGRAAPITVLPGLWAFWARQRRWGSVWWCEASNPQRGGEGSRPTCMSLYLYNQAIHRR